jgi:hypothetical protein
MNKLRFNQLLESTMGNVRPLLVEQTKPEKVKVKDTLGEIDCYRLNDITKMTVGTPSIKIGSSVVNNITQEEPGLWSVVVEVQNPSMIPDSPVGEVQTVYELDIVPLSRFFKNQLNADNPVDSKEMVVLTYDSTGQKHFCKAKNPKDQANIVAVNPASGG